MDKFDRATRSRIMSAIRSKNRSPRKGGCMDKQVRIDEESYTLARKMNASGRVPIKWIIAKAIRILWEQSLAKRNQEKKK